MDSPQGPLESPKTDGAFMSLDDIDSDVRLASTYVGILISNRARTVTMTPTSSRTILTTRTMTRIPSSQEATLRSQTSRTRLFLNARMSTPTYKPPSSLRFGMAPKMLVRQSVVSVA